MPICTAGVRSDPDGYYLIGIPDDLRDLFQQAYNVGARVHSNSWGGDANGDYTLDSADTDDFVWDNPDMAITSRPATPAPTRTRDGVVDNDSMGSPATAKNVITVGASENDRQGNWQCDTSLSYTTRARPGRPERPLHLRPGLAGRLPGQSPGQRLQRRATPSRWPPSPAAAPTDDGRIKPDVVAPGTWVLSGYSDLYQAGLRCEPTNPADGAYQYDGWGYPLSQLQVHGRHLDGQPAGGRRGGGGARLLSEGGTLTAPAPPWSRPRSSTRPSDLLDENNDGANDNDFPIPNAHEGWGRVNLATATDGATTSSTRPPA